MRQNLCKILPLLRNFEGLFTILHNFDLPLPFFHCCQWWTNNPAILPHWLKIFQSNFFLNLLIPQGGHSSYNCHYQSFPINELPKPGLFLPFLLNFWQKRNRDEGIQTENFWYPINLLHYLCHSPHLIFLTLNESISNLLGLLWPRRKQGSRAGLLADYAQSFQELQFLWTKITQKKPAAGETFLATCFLNGPFQASFFFIFVVSTVNMFIIKFPKIVYTACLRFKEILRIKTMRCLQLPVTFFMLGMFVSLFLLSAF